ncbi:fatty acid-binding protein, liver [Oryzias melastigma]|uniref:fatty acid-binding protein, liver n=1 Tax=Oryzias melastigma TaxID=30732 RepID=UPI00168CD2C4|nr:fatty acid-binding protein, liver [Oryzias melastigma]
MDFSGTWKVYSEENLEEFLKVIGAPEMIVKMRKDVKPVVVIEQNGKDFVYTIKTPMFTRCIVREENGKLICDADKFTAVREIQGDEMTETITSGSVTFISKSKRA